MTYTKTFSLEYKYVIKLIMKFVRVPLHFVFYSYTSASGSFTTFNGIKKVSQIPKSVSKPRVLLTRIGLFASLAKHRKIRMSSSCIRADMSAVSVRFKWDKGL